MTEERGLATRPAEGMTLGVSVEQALSDWQDYQRLTRELLEDSDYQSTGTGAGAKKFKKKSAWRKYARAFNIEDKVTAEHVDRDPDGWPVWARVRVKAWAPNGRESEAGHECHRSERCCDARWGRPCSKARWDNHHCCTSTCDGRVHWSHPGDITETALTRAKNRAISDLIGAGEVSAEEMDGQREAPAPKPAAGQRQQTPRPASPPPTGQVIDHEPDPGTPPWEDDDGFGDDGLVADEREAWKANPKVCEHGPMKPMAGTRKDGAEWKGWFCPTPKGTPDQCKPIFVNDR